MKLDNVPLPEMVLRVGENDELLGIEEKLTAHQQGILHRAFSIFVFNKSGDLLLQQRSHEKYHSSGRWSNTCCGHPRQGETTEDAAHRRLQEEMGFDCDLQEVESFTYRVQLDNGLIENEYDHIFVGRFDAEPLPKLHEVNDWRWMTFTVALNEAFAHPERYTAWFPLAATRVTAALEQFLFRLS